MKKILKAETVIKLNGIPVSLCSDVEVETHDGNATLLWGESGQIIRGAVGVAGRPIGNISHEKPVVRIDKLLEVIAQTFGVGFDTLKNPVRLQDAYGVEFGEFVVERLIIALLAEVVTNTVECHSVGGVVGSSGNSSTNVRDHRHRTAGGRGA